MRFKIIFKKILFASNERQVFIRPHSDRIGRVVYDHRKQIDSILLRYQILVNYFSKKLHNSLFFNDIVLYSAVNYHLLTHPQKFNCSGIRTTINGIGIYKIYSQYRYLICQFTGCWRLAKHWVMVGLQLIKRPQDFGGSFSKIFYLNGWFESGANDNRIRHFRHLQIGRIRDIKFFGHLLGLANCYPCHNQRTYHKDKIYPKQALVLCPLSLQFTPWAVVFLIVVFLFGTGVKLAANSFYYISEELDRKYWGSFLVHLVGGIALVLVALKLIEKYIV